MTLVEEIAWLLDELGVATFDPETPAGNQVFIGRLPESPDTAIAIARYSGVEAPIGHYDEPQIQFRVRGPATDARVAQNLAQAVYDAMHGLGTRYLAGGTWLQLAVGTQSGPIDIGQDEHGRPELTINVRLDVSRP